MSRAESILSKLESIENIGPASISLTRGMSSDINTHLLSVLLQIRTGILGIYDGPVHPDTVTDVYDLSGRIDTRRLQYELGFKKQDFYEWMREIAYAIYNGMDIDGLNKINKRCGVPVFPDGYIDNVPASFNKTFGDLEYHPLTEPVHD